MRQDYEKLFNQLKPALTPTGLFDQVVSRLGREQRLLSLRRRIALFTVSAVFSALALLPAGRAVWSGLSESGFTHFFSLIFSDAQIVLVYWQSFALSLLESLPIVSLISFFQSKTVGGAILGVVVFLMSVLIFKAGVIVGVKKSDFSCRWADNYHR